MMPGSSDKTTASGFLAGNRLSSDIIDGYLNQAVGPYRNRLGYEVEDVVSVARIKLYNYLSEGRFRFDCKLSSYVWQIVGSVAIDFVRKQRIRSAEDIETVEEPDNAPNPEQKLLRKEDVEIGFRAVLLMSAECRTLWQMYLIEEISQQKIAEKLGISHVNVRQKLHTCKKKARALLKKMTESG